MTFIYCLSFNDLTAFGLEEAFQFLFSGQFQLIFGNKEAVVHVGDGVFDQSVVFLGAEQQSHRWLASLSHHVLTIPGHIGVELTEVFVGEFVHLEFDEHMTFENTVVENQVDKSAS